MCHFTSQCLRGVGEFLHDNAWVAEVSSDIIMPGSK